MTTAIGTETARSCIVVVEDDPDIRNLISQVLELEGFSVRTYANGKEALDGLRNVQCPCLIFLDLMMPIMSGHEFLEARQSCNDKILQIPIVVVSAVPEQARGARGVHGLLKKPIDLDALLEAANRFCDRCAGSNDAA